MRADEARTLAESWVTHLEAEHKSAGTVKTYTAGLNAYIKWCEREGVAVKLEPGPVEKFMAGLFEGGAEPATVLSRQRGVRRFSAWLADDTGKPDRLDRMKPPKLDQQHRAVRRHGPDGRAARHVQDAHVPRPPGPGHHQPDGRVDGARRRAADHDHGRRERPPADGPSSSAARAARAGSPRSARGQRGTSTATSGRGPPTGSRPSRGCGSRSSVPGEPRLTYGGLYTALRRRALRADPPFKLHPHMLRSTGAIGFRRKGGQVTSLMALGGWSDISMVQRYIRAAENDLAIEEARRLFDGE